MAIAPINAGLPTLSILRTLQLQPSTVRRFAELASGQRQLTTVSPAGLVISQSLQAQLRGLNQLQNNLTTGVSFVQTAEGGVASIQEDLQRMRELAVQASNGLLTQAERQAINTELQQLRANIGQTVAQTTFNGQQPLVSDQDIAVGSAGGEPVVVPGQGAEIAAALGGLDVGLTAFAADPSAANAQALIGDLDAAIGGVGSVRATFGAVENRLSSVSRGLSAAAENTAAANSRIADTDMAETATQLMTARLLNQAATAVLAQANVDRGRALLLLSPETGVIR